MKLYYLFILFIAAAACGQKTEHTDGRTESPEVDARLVEASGLALSKVNPGLLWTINDSDRPNEVYLINDQGQVKLSCTLKDIPNRDWEDVAVGPGPVPSKSYVYVAEIGDNLARYKFKYLYRFEEPIAGAAATTTITDAKRLVIVLPDGKRDTETLMIDAVEKTFYMISKREDSVRVYTSPMAVKDDTLRMKEVVRLPMTLVTSGSISSDAQQVLIKNYGVIFYWQRHGEKSIAELLKKTPIKLVYDVENQGEAICWDKNNEGYYTLSESPDFGPRARLRYYAKVQPRK